MLDIVHCFSNEGNKNEHQPIQLMGVYMVGVYRVLLDVEVLLTMFVILFLAFSFILWRCDNPH